MELAQRITDTYQSSTPPTVAPLASPVVTCLERLELLAKAAGDKTLRYESLRVLIQLATYVSSDTGTAWPTQTTIGQPLGISRPNVNRALRELETHGYITRSQECVRPKGQSLTVYRLMMPPCINADTGITPDTPPVSPVIHPDIAPVIHMEPGNRNPVTEPGKKSPSDSSRVVPKAPKPAPKPPEPKPGYLPDDWQPDEQAITQAMARCQLTRAQVLDQLERFKVHYQGTLTKATNWYAKWGMWLKNVAPGGPYRYMIEPNGRVSRAAATTNLDRPRHVPAPLNGGFH